MEMHNGGKPVNSWLYSHGHSKGSGGEPGSRTYKSWVSMHRRCNDVKNKNYGGIGISVCERWSEFKNFLDDMGERPAGASIDRVNPNLGYFPENCRWATNSEQSRNKRTNKKVVMLGVEMTLSELAKASGIPTTTIYRRYDQGYRGDALVSKQNKNKGRRFEDVLRPVKISRSDAEEIIKMHSNGESQGALSKLFGVSRSVISDIVTGKRFAFETVKEQSAQPEQKPADYQYTDNTQWFGEDVR